MPKNKQKILFVYFLEPELVPFWRDGLWAALKLLEKDFDIEYNNIYGDGKLRDFDGDFVLGWGAFGSKVDKEISNMKHKKGLCIGGTTTPENQNSYDVLFYETNWYKIFIKNHPNIVHAFGVNTDIFNDKEYVDYKFIDYLSVGSFAFWKRHDKLKDKKGTRLVIGQIQKNNISESGDIFLDLILNDVGVMAQVPPEDLAGFYRSSRTVFIPASLMGGGERAVLEARACGVDVEIANDNEKLEELLRCPIYDHFYYAEKLKSGIISCINN